MSARAINNNYDHTHVNMKDLLSVACVRLYLFAAHGIPQTDRAVGRACEDVFRAVVVSSYVYRTLMSVQTDKSAIIALNTYRLITSNASGVWIVPAMSELQSQRKCVTHVWTS